MARAGKEVLERREGGGGEGGNFKTIFPFSSN